MSAIAPERTGATTGRAEVTTDRTEVTADRTEAATQAIEGSQSIRLAPNYWPFVVPALVVVSAVIVFPWAFTLWMSVNRWTLGQSRSFAGMENYLRLASDPRFWESLVHTLTYTSLSVAAPMLLGTVAALIFDARFPLRGLLRGVFVMPMMATPVAVALVWTMMFHPQLGVLNYLLSLVGIPAQEWIFNANTVIPSLVAVETWQWTPLVMLIVLGGLASVPREPFESAEIDGANAWQQFRYLTLPMIAPFLMIALIIRTIDALKSFDIIYAMTQGGPGTASETINIYLYNTAFSYYDIGYGSAMAVVFFIVIVALSFILLMLRQRSQWNDAEGK
ncbi:MAG: sugar ABC transporter permease [Mesorhizobium sp.]|uniref:carbohydrate ABC transporter permease n=1 Tax=Mesorhizobium sp. TaxID=1871066 RepID=UPI000FE4FDC9|nr:sugar ABC transporter permease [Mesorhizobium sp.]RWM97165.1 MAG: sugar ABC transporter permease [Mesorhizobium sp.]